MRWQIITGLLMLAVGSSVKAETIVLVNANVVDVVEERIIPNVSVVVEDHSRIAENRALRPEGAQIIDVEGKYLLPGYIDAHMHIGTVDGALRALYSGVTTARSASTPYYRDVGLNALFHAGGIKGPEIIPAGTFVEPNLGEAILGDPRLAPLHDGVNTDQDLRDIVQVNVDRGVKWIKTRNTFAPYDYFKKVVPLDLRDMREMVFSEDQVRLIVEEARKAGLPVMIHSTSAEASEAAVKAGVKSLEHGTYATTETLRFMKEKDVYLIPSVLAFEDVVKRLGDINTVHARKHILPMMNLGILDMWKRAYEIGVKMAIATDSPYLPTSEVSVSKGVTRYIELGMTHYEALRCAITTPAELLEVNDRTGQLKEGYEADIIVVYSNPIKDKYAPQDVVLVMSNGKIVRNHFPFVIK